MNASIVRGFIRPRVLDAVAATTPNWGACDRDSEADGAAAAGAVEPAEDTLPAGAGLAGACQRPTCVLGIPSFRTAAAPSDSTVQESLDLCVAENPSPTPNPVRGTCSTNRSIARSRGLLGGASPRI